MISQEVSLLPATWRDFRSIYALERICFPGDAWPWIDVLAALTFPETVRVKAIVGEEVVGFVFGDRRRCEKVGWIASIGVHPDLRRKGIGYLLLEACEEEVATPRIRLALRPSNFGAKQLYLKAGYEEVDRWDRYYFNGDDAIIMEKVR